MASDAEDEDLAALRMAALASMKPKQKPVESASGSPSHQPVSAVSSVPTIQSQGPDIHQGPSSSPQRQNFYRNDHGGFRGRIRGFGRGGRWRGQPGASHSGRGRGGRGGAQVDFPPPRANNLIVIRTVPLEGEEPSVQVSNTPVHQIAAQDKPKNKFLLLPQDRWAGTGSDSAPDSPPKTKVSNKFSRFESRDSDDDDDDYDDDNDDDAISEDGSDSGQQDSDGDQNSGRQPLEGLLQAESDRESLHESLLDSDDNRDNDRLTGEGQSEQKAGTSYSSHVETSKGVESLAEKVSPACRSRSHSRSPSRTLKSPVEPVDRSPSPSSDTPLPPCGVHRIPSPTAHQSPSPASSTFSLSPKHSPASPREQYSSVRGASPTSSSSSQLLDRPKMPSCRHSPSPRRSPPKSPPHQSSHLPLKRLSPDPQTSAVRKNSPQVTSPTNHRKYCRTTERSASPVERRSAIGQPGFSGRGSLSPYRRSPSPSRNYTHKSLVPQSRHSRSWSREPLGTSKSQDSSSDWSDSEFTDSSSLRSSPERESPKQRQNVPRHKQTRSSVEPRKKELTPKIVESKKKHCHGTSKIVKSVSNKKLHEKDHSRSSSRDRHGGELRSKAGTASRTGCAPDSAESERLAARRKKFQEGGEFRPESKASKTKISLKGIVCDQSSSRQKEKENRDKGSVHSRLESKPHAKRKKESVSRTTSKSKRGSNESEKVPLTDTVDSDDSEPEGASVDSLFSDSESDSDTAPWRYTHTGRSTKGRDRNQREEGKTKLFKRDSLEIERERRLRLKNKAQEETGQQQRGRDSSKGHNRYEHKTSSQQAETSVHTSRNNRSGNKQDRVKHRSRPKFQAVDSDGSGSEAEGSPNPPVRSFLSVVSRPIKSRSRSVSPAPAPRKQNRTRPGTGEQSGSAASGSTSTRVIVSGKKDRDARSLLSRPLPQPSSDEEFSDGRSTGRNSPVVNITFNSGAFQPEKGSGNGGGRLSVHQRLGLPVAKLRSVPISSRLGGKKHGDSTQQRHIISHHSSSPSEPETHDSRKHKRKEKHKTRQKEDFIPEEVPPAKRPRISVEEGIPEKLRQKRVDDDDEEDFSPVENELDAKIKKIKEKNAAILKRKRQVQAEQQKYGVPSQRI